MNTNTFMAIKNRLDLVLNCWYDKQILGFTQLLTNGSEELYIYNLYSSHWFSRVWLLLRYNFSLIRSKKKFFAFALLTLMPKKSF